MTKNVNDNLIRLNFFANQGAESALSLDGTMIVQTKGKHQTGDDLKKVIAAAKEAISGVDSFSLRLQGIDLSKVQKDLTRRVEEFKQERRVKLDAFGTTKTEDPHLDSALHSLVGEIAKKSISSKL